MAYVVTEACIKCKLMDCVKVCPVESFRRGRDDARHQPRRVYRLRRLRAGVSGRGDPTRLRAESETWVELNREYSTGPWPNISRKKEPPPDADAFKGVADKFTRFFSAKPGQRA